MLRYKLIFGFCFYAFCVISQTTVYRDTLSVFEQGSKLDNAWAGGINFAGFSLVDINLDGKKDLAIYDKVCNTFGKLRIYKNVGVSGIAHFKHAPDYENQIPAIKDWALFYDYNNDGKEDLFAHANAGIKVYKNTSSGSTVSFSLQSALLLSNYNPSGAPNIANIYSNSVGSPGFTDMDNDGDLDILTFSVLGTRVEFHKNMSQELYGHSDSLVFNMVDDCWGDISESSCAVQLNQCPLRMRLEKIKQTQKVLHSGSCLMCFDRDGDGDKDVAMGDISCDQVHYTENTGSSANAHIGDTTALFPNYPVKTSIDAVKMNTFPCAYSLDIDNDGKNDMLVSPNTVAGSVNFNSVWYYKNTTTTAAANFSLQQTNFLQDGMMEFGEGAFPTLFDADSDGIEDLIVGNMGYYIAGTNRARLAFYKNIGSATVPSFSLITKDYQTISAYNLLGAAPTFGDLDNDGDKDLLLGTSGGKISYLENTATIGNPAVFANYQANYQGIAVTGMAYPQIYDIDNDGLLDLLIGSNNFKLAYFKNKGSLTAPIFNLVTASFGNVSTKIAGYSNATASPFIYKEAGITKLLVGSEIGTLYYYDNIDGNLTGTFNKIDTNLFGINEGARCAPFFKDITNDGKRDLLLGNYAGGLTFYNSQNVHQVGIDEFELEDVFNIYPNPANDKISIKLTDTHFITDITYKLIDVLGNTVLELTTANKLIELDVHPYAEGIYILQYTKNTNNRNVIGAKKVIVKH